MESDFSENTMLTCMPYLEKEHFPFVSALFTEAFPGYSTLELDKCLEAAENGRIHCPILYDGNKEVGFVFMKDYGSFNFVFYFAISSLCSGHAYTRTFLTQWFAKNSRQLIWEVERPFTATARHRIDYLQRCGLVLNTFDYQTLMPEMVPPGIQYYLMSRWMLTREEYRNLLEVVSTDKDF